MGSGASREDVIGSKWWEVEAQKMLTTTTSTSTVAEICSLIPFKDGKTAVQLLKARSDLDTLFALHGKYKDLCEEQHAGSSGPPLDFKASELWRTLQSPLGYRRSPWDWNWQPPLQGDPSDIAAEIHVAVCRATFQVPCFDYIKSALGFGTKAHFFGSLLHAVCDVRDGLRTVFHDHPGTKAIYVEVETNLKKRHHPLAYWIIASSLYQTTDGPYDALASKLELIQDIFATRNLDLVLKRLAALDRRLVHANQAYNWQWSNDLRFWGCVDEILWTGKLSTYFVPAILSSEDWEEKWCFLEGFKVANEDNGHSIWSKAMFSIKRRMMRERNLG